MIEMFLGAILSAIVGYFAKSIFERYLQPVFEMVWQSA